MKTVTRLFALSTLALALAACGKKEEAATAQPAEAAPLSAPAAGSDDAAWKKYLTDVVTRNMGDITNAPFVYYLASNADQGSYDRQLEQASNAMARGVTSGNMIAFGSPDSARIADMAVASFAKAEPNTFKGVRVLFVGAAADQERVKAAVEPSGATFVFVEAK
ncbi:hypothetical protein [Pseudoxanthomonas composti]|uniref:Uncharacterized protein n=1 Tax=Pseudoxanthomonas composti TaxID=2137479 RepID=A0A4Q1JYR3_9GAMM|nr:hypothetical protein [Pseudoxanthomonas composti]RXR08464.1 hypothetical protein EPA99_01160 [Pseudoxanthomonas composti]